MTAQDTSTTTTTTTTMDTGTASDTARRRPQGAWLRFRDALTSADWAAPVLLSLLVGAVVLAVSGWNPFIVYQLLFTEAFGGWEQITGTLTATTPLLFVGVATAVAFRAGVFTLGVDGSFVAGGLAAAVVGAHAGSLPAPLVIAVALLAALAVGLAVAAGPALLRTRWNVDEVVTTLMLNFVVSGVASWLVRAYFRVPGPGVLVPNATAFVAGSAELPRLSPPSQVNLGLLIALLMVAAYGVWIRRTPGGYESRQVGLSTRFARAQGVNVRRVVLTAMLAAGAIGGLGGGVHTLGVVHRYVAGFSAGYGFTGLAIGLLARFSPAGIVACSVLFGGLTSAGSTIQLFSDIPLDIINVLQGTVMIFAVAKIALPRVRARRPPRAATPDGTPAVESGAAP